MSVENDLGIVWGAEDIAKAIGVNRRRAFYLLENGDLPARKVGGRWCVTRDQLQRFFEGATADA